MLELILKGTDLFMKKTGSADKLHICGNAERMLFLIIGILLVFAGAKVYRLIVSFIMFWGVTIALCTVMNGKTGWGTIVTAFTILGCLMGYMAFKWKTADAMILSAMTAAAVVWMCYPFWWVVVIFAAGAAVAAAFFPLEGAILSSGAVGMCLLYETGVRYVVFLVVCGLLFQIVLFERKSERGRKEIKYLISRREAMILQQKLDGIMERDIHGENGRYFIRSQYYDSIDDQDLWDNLDGMYEKRKLRLRIYSLNDLSAKLEFKCKNGSDGVKYSIPVSREQALRMEQGDASFLLEYETELAMRLYLRITQGCYRPKTIIDYQRLAFAYPAGDVRITFDTDIRGALYPYGLFENVGTDALGSTEQVLMEVKYTGFLPDMIAEILKKTDELSTSHSKYSRARMRWL